MSRDTKEGVMMRFKTITTNLSTIVHLLVEPITSPVKPKASLEASIYIRQLPWTINYSKLVMSPSLFSVLFFGNMLRSKRYWWGTIESHVGISTDHCGGRYTTGKIKCTTTRNFIYINDLIKGRCVLWWGPSIRRKRIIEAILSKLFQ